MDAVKYRCRKSGKIPLYLAKLSSAQVLNINF